MEILIVGIIMIFLFNYLNLFNFNKFVSDNKSVFNKLKEDDYEFLLVAKYGDKVDPILRYQKRVKSHVRSNVSQLNKLDFNKLFKDNTLIVSLH